MAKDGQLAMSGSAPHAPQVPMGWVETIFPAGRRISGSDLLCV